ncbi:MAG: MtrB/PioB family decaheme-associated outer membrane protein [Methylococcales bacterium]
MKIRNEEMKVSIMALAIRCALLATTTLPFGTYAIADDSTDALTKPSNTINFGALYADQSSARFGQYNGLNSQGAYGLGGLDIRGGNGYDQNSGSGLRWKLGGSNLGTTSRELDGSVSDQGKWKINLGYDELQHNITNSYQTPLQGNPGDNNFTLPSNFGSINTSANGGTRSIGVTPPQGIIQKNDFQGVNESVNRKTGSFSTTYTFNPQFNAQIDYKHIDQSGAKLIGTGAQAGIASSNGFTSVGEANMIILNPTSYQTDNVNAALNWKGDKGHLSGGYYGSIFHDDYNSLSWQSPMTSTRCTDPNCYANNTMSTAPSNSLHQANLTGGYNFGYDTKIAGGFSYGYNQQNSSYAPTSIPQAIGGPSIMMQANGLPTSSLNGVVETKHGDIKLTNQSIKDLTLTAGYKINERDNNTASNTYLYNVINSTPYTGVNTPYSNRKMQYEATAAYRITNAQNVNFGYEHESIKRWCNGVVGGAQCVSSPASNEDKMNLAYRLKALDNVNFNAGYTYANRRADNDPSFLANAGNYASTTAVSSSALNAGNYLGYIAYPYANRNQNIGKAGVNWQVTQKLDVGVNGRYTYDNYDVSLGVQNGKSTGVNVDTTYNFTEKSNVSAYWNWQNGQRNLRSGINQTSRTTYNPLLGNQTNFPRDIWTNQLDDNSQTVGIMGRHGGLFNNKLEFIGDLSYTIDTTSYSTQVPYTLTNSAGIPSGATCGATNTLSCGALSPIKNEMWSLKLTSNYQLYKNGKLSLTYMYQKLNSNDYYYNGQQTGYTPSALMPTNLQMQNYAVSVIGLTYNHSF